MEKLLIGIPAFNEQNMIGDVISGLPNKLSGIGQFDVLVVDDGSADKTGFIAQGKGAVVITHLINRGLGAALKTIFEFAKKNDYDYLITFDADGQHQGKDITRLVQILRTAKKDVVIGSRWLEPSDAPFLRVVFNRCANFLTYFLFSQSTTDSQSGLRGFNKKAIQNIILLTDGMEVSSEFFKEINRNKLTVTEIPIKAIYTRYSQIKGQQYSNAPSLIFQLLLRFFQ